MHRRLLAVAAVAAVLAGCTVAGPGPADAPGTEPADAPGTEPADAGGTGSADPPAGAEPRPHEVGVQLFQWTWDAIAAECERTLGPAGYGWVMTSPPQEHVLGEPWWTAYQPVSYRLESRLGTREELAAMVTACDAAGVQVYADAVVNHMTGIDDAAPAATGWGGSTYSHYDYPGLWTAEDFHHCGLTPDDDIADYSSSLQVQTCELVNLADLRTEEPHVREVIGTFLSDLTGLGVRGLRIDAAKHMRPEDVAALLEPLDGEVDVLQEVIRGPGEPIVPEQYVGNGSVYEFAWGRDIIGMLQAGSLRAFADLGTGPGYLDDDVARVFVDNHDTERNGSTFSYADGASYALANVLLLAGGYGRPVVYSGYAFGDRDAGPAQDADGAVLDASCRADVGVTAVYEDRAWVCQHAWPVVAGMVSFHNATLDEPVTAWWDDGRAIAFGRGEAGFVVVNKDDAELEGRWSTTLPAGSYCDVTAGPMVDGECAGATVEVAEDGVLHATVPAEGALAVHVRAVPPA